MGREGVGGLTFSLDTVCVDVHLCSLLVNFKLDVPVSRRSTVQPGVLNRGPMLVTEGLSTTGLVSTGTPASEQQAGLPGKQKTCPAVSAAEALDKKIR